VAYLKVLRKNNRGGLALYMDQLSVHRTVIVKNLCAELDITILFNVSYSPELNPIESVFSQVKRTYARARLQLLANGGLFDQTEEVRVAFRLITREVIRACVRKSMHLLREFR
jgi:transposase